MDEEGLQKIMIERQDIILIKIRKIIDKYFEKSFQEKKEEDILTPIIYLINESDKCEKTDLDAYLNSQG